MMNTNTEKKGEWFEGWFDSPFYHVLYKHRDDREAQEFISNLMSYLNPSKTANFIDVACGKGRHSLFLNSLGYNVDGFDLSGNSIKTAQLNESDSLHFYVNDIRNPLKRSHYNYAFNLFTSFGYFDDDKDNQKSMNAIGDSLCANGVVVLDFMNCNKVIKNLNKHEVKVVEGIEFNITRDYRKGYITKDITFQADNNQYHFQEKVKAISLADFKSYFSLANLNIESIFGDYNLTPFNEANSDRLILVARKK